MDTLNDGFRDAECAITAPAETGAGRLDDEDSGFVFEEPSYGVRAQAPPLGDVSDREVTLQRVRLMRLVRDGL